MDSLSVLIRDMKESDLDQVLMIETGLFESPWSRTAFTNELKKEYARCFIAEAAGEVAGYLIQWIVGDEIHIANIAVHPAWQRKGVGTQLLLRGMSMCPACTWIGLEVRESNQAARALYLKQGFVEVGLRKDYYGKNQHALLMVKTMANSV